MDFKKEVLKPALDDLRVELLDEFDQNFERKAFFDEAWEQVKNDPGIGSLMNRHGVLRGSLRAEVRGETIAFTSSTPYAEIHNEGGQVTTRIPVTDKMRRWAWYMYSVTDDDKYKGMALTKKTEITATFSMPKRQFIGTHPIVTKSVEDILDEHVKPFLNDFINSKLKP